VGGDDLHQTGEPSDPEQVLAYLAGVDIGQPSHHERPFSRPADTLELPGHVADEGIALAGWQRDENVPLLIYEGTAEIQTLIVAATSPGRAPGRDAICFRRSHRPGQGAQRLQGDE
jgi:hypothetical protein